MSTYENFLDDILKSEYVSEKAFKSSGGNSILLFKHKTLGTRLVKITSENRNDDCLRVLRGENHKNLPKVLEVCSCEEHLLVLEEFVEGELLSERLLKGSLSESDVLSVILQILEALGFLHSKGIIHRDVKPDNVIITPEGKAVLIDFSAARFMKDGIEHDTSYLGTVGYAAPEQYGVFQSLPQTDIYAVGVMLNEMLVNTHPTVEIPKGKLGRIVRKCTDTQIFKRYKSTEELVKDIKKYKKFRVR